MFNAILCIALRFHYSPNVVTRQTAPHNHILYICMMPSMRLCCITGDQNTQAWLTTTLPPIYDTLYCQKHIIILIHEPLADGILRSFVHSKMPASFEALTYLAQLCKAIIRGGFGWTIPTPRTHIIIINDELMSHHIVWGWIVPMNLSVK